MRFRSRCEMLDQIDQLRKVERLRQNCRDAHLQHRLRLDAQMRGNDDDRNAADLSGLLKPLQKIPAVDARHREIEQDDVRIVQVDGALPLFAVARQKHLKSVLSQRRRKHSAERQIVVDHQNALAIDIGDPLVATALRNALP